MRGYNYVMTGDVGYLDDVTAKGFTFSLGLTVFFFGN